MLTGEYNAQWLNMDELSLSLPGIDQLDLDSFEVPYVARNEGEAVLQGCGCDHGIAHVS
jgi:hypothetical protein